MAYDQATGAPVGISSGIGQSSTVQSLIYTWDGFGNLEQRCDANRGLAENVTNDDLNRLTGTTVYTGVGVSGSTCAGGSTTNTLALSYDVMGNITSRTVNGTVETYGYDTNDPSGTNHPYAVNNVTSGGSTIYSASYDNNGNMITRNSYPITWTPSNLPSSIASANGSSTFSYDPDHARYYQSTTFNGVTTDTTYVGGLFEVVSTSSGTTEYRHNIVADGQVIAVHTIDGNGSASTAYLHYDHLGSVNAITDDSGSVVQAMSFDAFGLRRDATNWDYDLSQNTLATLKNYTDRGFTDQEQLDNVSLVDLNGRVYDPTVGRFISADPTVPAPFFSQAFNRYSYVYNSPLEYTDPSGYCSNAPGNVYYGDCQTIGTPFCVGRGPCDSEPQPPPPLTNIPLPNGQNGPSPDPIPTPNPGPLPSPNPVPAPPTPPAPAPSPHPGSGGQPSPCASFGCDSPDGGDNGVLTAINSTDGWQVWNGVCFGCGMASTPSYDPRERYDFHPLGRWARELAARQAGASAPHSPGSPGGGPMHRKPPMLGTMGLPQPRFEFISHVGVYGKVDIRIGPVRLGLEVNLASYNTPLSGQPYWSHGISLSGQVSSWEIGFSWEQQSCDGGLSFQSLPSNFFLGSAHASKNGLRLEISPPQAFAGFTTGVVFPSSSASSGCE